MPYRVGDTLGAFTVERLLGRGAYGEVFLVRGQLHYAMKVIPCDLGPNKEIPTKPSHFRERAQVADPTLQAALAEASLLQELRYPHIVSCEEILFDIERSVVCLVLEYMDGGDLHGLIEQHRRENDPFDGHFPRRVLAAVGGALQYIHEMGILHRDVKPANVLLSRRSCRIKLADFGIAKLVEAATLKAHTLVGTPYYFSPELVSGEEYGPPADCWALGAVLYEIVALRRPFEASNQLALVRKICEEIPAALPAETADDISAAVDGLLQKDVRKRMSMAEVLSISSPVAALVAPSFQANEEPTEEECYAEDASAPDCDGDTFESDSDSWHDADLVTSWRASNAAGLARAALGADEDDPEELRCALQALQMERRSLPHPDNEDPVPEGYKATIDPPDVTQFEGNSSLSQSAGTSRRGVDGVDAPALESLAQEIQVRLSALRHDATAFLEELFLNGEDAEEREKSEAPNAFTAFTDDNGSLASAEDAIEVATTLGVETGAAEERLASIRRMLSVRVAWDEAVRFCLLPLRVSFNALLQQVAARFHVKAPSTLQLCWKEAGDLFRLDGDMAWEECLQRRGLAERPGRVELEVLSSTGPPQRRRRRRKSPKTTRRATDIEPGTATFLVTGTQALHAPSVQLEDLQSSQVRGDWKARTRFPRGKSSAAGRAWAMSTGREPPVRSAQHAPQALQGGQSRKGDLMFCLEGSAISGQKLCTS